MRDFNRIFGIGISRTGTTSLTLALKTLGLPAVHWPTKLSDFIHHKCVTDTTVACRFKELDQIFPNSLFIYTERARENWLKSVLAYGFTSFADLDFTPEQQQFVLEARIRIYGKIAPTMTDIRRAYLRHHAEVLCYFSDKSDRFLRMKICHGEGWPSLCKFLDIPVPNIPFPHAHKKA